MRRYDLKSSVHLHLPLRGTAEPCGKSVIVNDVGPHNEFLRSCHLPNGHKGPCAVSARVETTPPTERRASPPPFKAGKCNRCRAEGSVVEIEMTTLYPTGPRGSRLVSTFSLRDLCPSCMQELNKFLAGETDRPQTPPDCCRLWTHGDWMQDIPPKRQHETTCNQWAGTDETKEK